jgi:hypothetical protein
MADPAAENWEHGEATPESLTDAVARDAEQN